MIRIAGYPMDLALAEEHTFPGEVTSYPVEGGADVSDHIRDLPEEITLECIVSDSPIGDIATDPTRQIAGADAPLPSADALAKLRELKALRRPVSVETSLGVFESMAIIDLTVPVDAMRSPGTMDPGGNRDKDQRGGLFFTISLRKIVTVTNRRTRVRVKTNLAGAGGKAKPKAVTGTPLQIDDTIIWRHGSPPGTAFQPVVDPFEVVRVRYDPRPGKTREESIALGRVDPASPFITYIDSNGKPIAGGTQRYNDLIADLRRDAADKRLGQARALRQTPSEAVEDALANVRRSSLPAGIDLSRVQRPAPPPLPFQNLQPINGVP